MMIYVDTFKIPYKTTYPYIEILTAVRFQSS